VFLKYFSNYNMFAFHRFKSWLRLSF
jgi:hypothetical protein